MLEWGQGEDLELEYWVGWPMLRLMAWPAMHVDAWPASGVQPPPTPCPRCPHTPPMGCCVAGSKGAALHSWHGLVGRRYHPVYGRNRPCPNTPRGSPFPSEAHCLVCLACPCHSAGQKRSLNFP